MSDVVDFKKTKERLDVDSELKRWKESRETKRANLFSFIIGMGLGLAAVLIIGIIINIWRNIAGA